MRIPLDYYRILGLPHHADPEQVQQAHRDRLLSMPRREYSDAVVTSRRRLFDLASSILLDPEKRAVYDATILPDTQTHDQESSQATQHTGGQEIPQKQANLNLSASLGLELGTSVVVITPTIEVDDKDIAGALLILLELGEYDKVLNISRVFIDTNTISPQAERSPHNPDIILTVALAYLEMGRDHWKQGHYEAAAQALETGQELLLREGLFISIRSEIQADLFKLRPYRILELLATPDYKTDDHRQGLLLLQEMLEARRGIDGSGNDYSGLSIDDFLRFMQQLRSYMTTAEQQKLFEEESRRPSPVASYLAVYALIARGFSQCQPALIRRAKGLLLKLSTKQDVHLEQAVCALLLGQTDEASSILELSGEQEQITFIRQYSEGAPDLLPGLCLYSEKWLQEEVYPHFRDLANETASLKSYFADDQVQSYLEELPNTNGAIGSEWTISPTARNGLGHAFTPSTFTRPTAKSTPPKEPSGIPSSSPWESERSSHAGTTSVIDRPLSRVAPRVSRLSGSRSTASMATAASSDTLIPLPKPLRETSTQEAKKPRTTKSKRKVQVGRFLIVVVTGLGLVFGLVSLAAWGWRSLTSPSSTKESLTILELPLMPVLDVMAKTSDTVVAKSGPMDKELAAKVVEAWQSTKSKALGNTYEIDTLDSILVDPVLTDWKSRAKELKDTNSYLQYITKSVDVKNVVQEGEDKARVTAMISETRNYFNNGNLDSGASKEDANYEVEYDLVRQDNTWLIKDMIVSE